MKSKKNYRNGFNDKAASRKVKKGSSRFSRFVDILAADTLSTTYAVYRDFVDVR